MTTRSRRRDPSEKAITSKVSLRNQGGDIGIVLSGGGSRAAYQVGALRALIPYFQASEHPITVVVGSSIGAINAILLASAIDNGIEKAVTQLEDVWRERTFRNTFSDHPTIAFFRAIRIAFMQYMSPGPNPSGSALFDPSPLMNRVDEVLKLNGGTSPENRDPKLHSVAVMTTVEGETRRPLLFVSSHQKLPPEAEQGASFEILYSDELTAKHGFASAALPAILPPVEIDTEHGTVSLVDGGISQNVPVDPAVRMGADRCIVVDISGRQWWLDRYKEPHDTRPKWEVPAGLETYCLRPPDTFIVRGIKPLGPLLESSIGKSQRKFIRAVGPMWPLFSLIKNKLGEDVAYEVMSYIALDPDYLSALIERGYNETVQLLRNKTEPVFEKNESYDELVEAL